MRGPRVPGHAAAPGPRRTEGVSRPRPGLGAKTGWLAGVAWG